MKAQRGEWMHSSTLSLISAIDGWAGNAMPRSLYPGERDPVPIVQEPGWTPGPVWTGAENVRNGIRPPDRP